MKSPNRHFAAVGLAFAVVIVWLLATLPAPAQTNAPVSVTNVISALPGGIQKLASDAQLFFTDASPYFGTNGTSRPGIAAIYSDHQWGVLAEVQVVSLATNNQVSLGFSGAYLGGQWYDATLSFNAGTTWAVPVIGNVYTFAESGPGYNLSQHSAVVQSFAGVVKAWDISGGRKLGVFGGVGNISTRSGWAYLLGVNFQY